MGRICDVANVPWRIHTCMNMEVASIRKLLCPLVILFIDICRAHHLGGHESLLLIHGHKKKSEKKTI